MHTLRHGHRHTGHAQNRYRISGLGLGILSGKGTGTLHTRKIEEEWLKFMGAIESEG